MKIADNKNSSGADHRVCPSVGANGNSPMIANSKV
jgi:hypothetical protein